VYSLDRLPEIVSGPLIGKLYSVIKYLAIYKGVSRNVGYYFRDAEQVL